MTVVERLVLAVWLAAWPTAATAMGAFAAWWVFFTAGPEASLGLCVALGVAWTVGLVVQDVTCGRWVA